MAHVNRPLVIELLGDESISYREIARRANCSDWSVRTIAREVAESQSIKHPEREPLTPAEWWTGVGIALLLFGGLCFAAWHSPRPSEQ